MSLTPAIQPQAEQTEETAQKRHNSKGERLFNWLTYGGIAGLGTFILTIPITYWAKYGGGAPGFASAAKKLESWGMHARHAEDAVMTTATMQSGNLTLLPVKGLEKHKPAIVAKLNTMLGDPSGDASVDQEPEQTWGSLIKGRVTAWVMIFSSFSAVALLFGKNTFSAFKDKFATHIVCKPLGKPTHFPGMAKTVENETRLFRYGRIAAIDVFATAAASTILYIGSHFFAKNNPRWHTSEIPADTLANVNMALPAIVSGSDKRFTDSVAIPPPGFAENIERQKGARETAAGVGT